MSVRHQPTDGLPRSLAQERPAHGSAAGSTAAGSTGSDAGPVDTLGRTGSSPGSKRDREGATQGDSANSVARPTVEELQRRNEALVHKRQRLAERRAATRRPSGGGGSPAGPSLRSRSQLPSSASTPSPSPEPCVVPQSQPEPELQSEPATERTRPTRAPSSELEPEPELETMPDPGPRPAPSTLRAPASSLADTLAEGRPPLRGNGPTGRLTEAVQICITLPPTEGEKARVEKLESVRVDRRPKIGGREVIKLTVKPDGRPEWKIIVDWPGWIKDIKEAVLREVGVPVEEQVLTFRGKKLVESLTHPAYQLWTNSTIRLTQKSLLQLAQEHRIMTEKAKQKSKAAKYLRSLFDYIGPDEHGRLQSSRVVQVLIDQRNSNIRRALNLRGVMDSKYARELKGCLKSMPDAVNFEQFRHCLEAQFGSKVVGGVQPANPALSPLPPLIPAGPESGLRLFSAKTELDSTPEWHFRPDETVEANEFEVTASRLRIQTKKGGTSPVDIYAQSVLEQLVNESPVDSRALRAVGDPKRWDRTCRQARDSPHTRALQPVAAAGSTHGVTHSSAERQARVEAHQDVARDDEDQLEPQVTEATRETDDSALASGVSQAFVAGDRVAFDDSANAQFVGLVGTVKTMMTEDTVAIELDDFERVVEVQTSQLRVFTGVRLDCRARSALKQSSERYTGSGLAPAQIVGLALPSSSQSPVDDRLNASCFIFKQNSIIRLSCKEVAQSNGFEFVVLLLIAANSVVLAMYDPKDKNSDFNASLEELGKYFTLAFTGEMLLKSIAWGLLLGDGAYLKNPWNVLDFIVVVTGYADFIPGFDNDFGVFRTLRLLRPLKTLTTIRSMRVLVSTVLSAQTLNGMLSVCLLCLVMLTVFGIIGTNMFKGVLRQRCIEENQLVVLDQICARGSSGFQCNVGSFCSAIDPITGLQIENPNYSLVSFDDFGMSVLTIFTMVTLEGWTDVMYAVQDGYSKLVYPYFVILIAFGSFISVNLFLAVISSGYETVVSKSDEEKNSNEYAQSLLAMITEAAYKSIMRDRKPVVESETAQETKSLIRIGDMVELSREVAPRCTAMGIGNLRVEGNLDGCPSGGMVAALSVDGRRVRVDVGEYPEMVQISRFYWYAIEEVQLVGGAEAAANAGPDKNLLQPSARLIQERVHTFFAFFDKAGDGKMDGLIDKNEFKMGLRKLSKHQMEHETEDHTNRSDTSVFIDDEVIRLLLQLLTDENKRGREKQWQETNMAYMFEALDANGSQYIDRFEFYDHFMNPEKWRVEEEEVLTCGALTNEKMKGKSFRHVLELHCRWLVTKGWFDSMIAIVVIFNCGVLASETYSMGDDTKDILDSLNLMCTFFFLGELLLKLFGLGLEGYWADLFNRFDGLIVLLSLIELLLPDSAGLSVFRALRILRIFKLTKSLGNFKKVLVTIIAVLPEVGNFFGLLVLCMFFFAVLGLHLFGGSFASLDEYPRSNFDSFPVAMLTVFQALTGENWNSVMYDTVKTNGSVSILYFVMLQIIGTYLLLNLFLSVLLLKTMSAFMPDRGARDDILYRAHKLAKPPASALTQPEDEFQLEGKSLFICSTTNGIRLACQKICRNSNFDNFILFCIIVSSVSLAVEEPDQEQSVLDMIKLTDVVFAIIFTVEMLVKIVTLGFAFGTRFAYVRNPWNMLDGTIVVAGLVPYFLPSGSGDISFVRGFRVLRALRPLRVIKRVPELRMVVNSMFRSIPTIANVLILLVMFWMVFGILGLQLFGGKFYSCNDGAMGSAQECAGTFLAECADDSDSCQVGMLTLSERTWDSPQGWGFDNMAQAMLTLFEVSTLEMWLDIMYWAMDSTEVDLQPVFDATPLAAVFFAVFIMLGSFFFLEMFVGAIVTSYNMLNEESEGGAFQSERQKRAVAKMVLRKKADVFVPLFEFQDPLYKLVHNSKFENLIAACILLNVVVMAMDFDGMSTEYSDMLELLNHIFTFIFALEAVLKILAELPRRYFSNGWNVYDFIVVVVTVGDFMYMLFASDELPLAAVLRVFRIMRLFRLMRRLKTLMNLVQTIANSAPTLMNVGSVLFLIYFIYGVLGMHLFGKVRRGEFLNQHANFESFGTSLLTVFRMSTGESWNGIMHDCQIKPPDCNDQGDDSDCGEPIIAPVYFVSFQIIGQFIMLNLFIAVLLEYYQRTQDAVDPFVTNADVTTFNDYWASFVGRDPVSNEPYKLLPVRLFDAFMAFLPERIGWTMQERRNPKLKVQALHAAPLNTLPVRSMHTLVPWRPGLPKNTPDRWQKQRDKLAEEEEKALERGDLPSAEAKKETLAGAHRSSWIGRAGASIKNSVGSVLPQIGGPRQSFGEVVGLTDAAGVDRTGGDTNTATLEQHYFHFDEVWHCLYNRMEMGHLRDPENLTFKSEEARKRQINNFSSIMSSTKVELAQRVTSDVDNDNSAKVTALATPTLSSSSAQLPTLEYVHVAQVLQRLYRQKRSKKRRASQGVTPSRQQSAARQALAFIEEGTCDDASESLIRSLLFGLQLEREARLVAEKQKEEEEEQEERGVDSAAAVTPRQSRQ